jgi:mannose-6-phosphate isomerase-like protein (cupin superfamily)
VQVGEKVTETHAGDEIFIPRGAKHRLRNQSSEPFRMLEVAYGDVQDDDKVRYEDKYGRA